jgi:exonuclease III
MCYIILRGRWCRIILLNVCAPTEDKIDDVKDKFYEEVERVFDKFPKYHIKILLGDFNAKMGREDIFKPTVRNKRLHEISNDNRVRLVNFSTSKNLRVKSTMFLHRNIHKYTWTSPDGKNHIQILFWQRAEGIRIYLMFDHSGQQIAILTIIWLWQKLGRD